MDKNNYCFILKDLIYCFIIITIIYLLVKKPNLYNIRIYKHYITMCKKMIKLYPYEGENNEKPFFSICIPVYNMEKYIETSIISVLNQSFRDFEILIINDYSLDNSEKIIKNLQNDNHKIKLINHNENLGVYKTRVDLIKNAKGNFIIFLDPDDLFSNENLLKKLYEFNLIYNLDIIEFSILLSFESKNNLYYPSKSQTNHFHYSEGKIINHPELSNILFFSNNKYSRIICRCLWNKMIRKDLLLKAINFLGYKTYKKIHFDFAEDTIINVLNFEFASNYSNLNLYGYMYNVRSNSMSHSKEKGGEMNSKMANNIVYFYRLFYNYIKYFNKDINYLFYDLKHFDYYFKYINDSYSSSLYKRKIIKLYTEILNEKNISKKFRIYAKKSLKKFHL